MAEIEEVYRWEKFRLEIFIRCARQEAFDAWASASGIQRWFRKDVRVSRNGRELNSVSKFEAGDEMQWADFVGQELTKSRILSVMPGVSIKQTFENEKVWLTNEVRPSGNGVVLTLTQENMPIDENGKAAWHLSCCAGWTFFLTNLKSVLENKIDLRGQGPETTFQVAKYIYDETWK